MLHAFSATDLAWPGTKMVSLSQDKKVFRVERQADTLACSSNATGYMLFEEQIAGIDDILSRHPHHQVGSGVAR